MLSTSHFLSTFVYVIVLRIKVVRREPWLSFFDPANLMARLRELGFTEVWDLGPEEANTRYFGGRTDGLCILNIGYLMKAHIGRGS